MKNSVRLNWKPAREKVASLPPLPEPRHRILASICILIYKNESSSTATHLDIIFQGRVRRKRQYHILASAILLRPRRTSWLCWSSYFPEDLSGLAASSAGRLRLAHVSWEGRRGLLEALVGTWHAAPGFGLLDVGTSLAPWVPPPQIPSDCRPNPNGLAEPLISVSISGGGLRAPIWCAVHSISETQRTHKITT